ncbi:hypothetical protein [Bradyrhizobium neotropicale]|uniref:hypothetical protein n=1 Tax=Bradyrhizobium neotropicale TaxID=1497615 RepID=UPI001AD7AABA|nr:hypothetical protein [Bradyrhizobium neotropicale]MBO4222003.1 hypothetical protein [Bradyrhizobium neotropicale]
MITPIDMAWNAYRDLALETLDDETVEQARIAFFLGAYHIYQLMSAQAFLNNEALQQATRQELQAFLQWIENLPGETLQ